MTASRSKASNYRPEIQGIRTIGALLVAIFHIWGGRVSGGVDVFFVISGFLITGSLYREIKRTGTIDVFAFWGRIAKRIAPMAYAVLALTLLAALLWMPHSRQQGFLVEVVASALQLENIKLMMSSVDYLARDDAPSPVQQFWALSVQVQFYAIWPFLLLAIAWLSRSFHHAAKTCLCVLAAVFAASLVYSILQTRLDPAPTYFNTLARVWEFALGGALAIALPYLNLPAKLRLAAGWAGLLAVVSCGLVIPATAHYPGYVALWPTLGAALIVLSGGGGTAFGADRILASRPLVALGDISFSFYLWHWPILVFFLIVGERTQLGFGNGLLVIATALAGAYATNRWLERPIQRSSLGGRFSWQVHAMALGLALPVIAAAIGWFAFNQRQEIREALALERRMKDYPGGRIAMSPATAIKPNVALFPSVAEARSTAPPACRSEEGSGIFACTHGRVNGARKTIVLTGGAQAEQWLPALEVLASGQQWKIVVVADRNCPAPGEGSAESFCPEWSDAIRDAVLKIHPDVVFTPSTLLRREGAENIPESSLRIWRQLAEHGITFIAVRHTPTMRMDVLDCVEDNRQAISNCAVPRRQLFAENDPSSRLNPKPRNVRFIDLTDRFCDKEICLPVGGNVLAFRDAHHITAEYSRSLARRLGLKMRQARPDLFLSASLEDLGGDYPGGAHPMALETTLTRNVPVYPRAAAVKSRHPNHCQQNETQSEVLTCVYGELKNPTKTIALVGGSHAEHWLPALERLAQEYKWRIVAVTKSACQFSTEVERNPSCAQWNRDVQGVLVRIGPDAIFTTSSRRRSSTESIEYVPEGYLDHWRQLADKGFTVIAIRDSARTKADAPDCIEANRHDIAKCAVARDQLFDAVDPSTKLEPKPSNVSFIDLTDRFCDETRCYPVGGNVLIFRDTHHITMEYARTLAGPLGERMRQVRPDLFPGKAG